MSAAVATLASGAGAQAGPMVPVCPDGAAPTVDSSIVVVGLAPSPEFRGRRYSAAQRLHILYIADAIRARFVPPPSLGALPVVGDASSGDPRQRAVARSVLHAEFIVVLRPDGHLRRIAWQVQPLSAPLGDALLTAVRAAEDSGALAEIHAPAGAKGDDTLAITLVTTNDSTPPELPLMRARVPVFVVDSLPMVVKMNLPAYPEAARAARVPGEVEAWFVLGSDSHVMPESVQFRRADWQEFIGPIRTALTTSRFQAAQSGGCRVPTFARQRFAFELR
ncbi:MAG: hypothetical protein IT355_11635 [Gemmatimonadaceae bacterium]|nr:hypothetical protein [Gemmatimonadaceae bacterium]